MGKYSRLGKNTLLIFIGNIGSRIVNLLMLPFYTRWLSVDDYGMVDIINVYVSLLLSLTTACISEAIFLFPKDQKFDKQKSYFSSGLFFAIISLLMTFVLLQCTIFVFEYKELSNNFVANVWLIYGLMATSFLQQYIQQFVRSIDKIKIYSSTGVVLTILNVLFSFFLIPKLGVFGYVYALILANVTSALYSLFLSRTFEYVSIKALKKEACIEMLKYSFPLIPNSIVWWLVGAINRPIMAKYLGLHAIGIFAVSNKFPGIISMVFAIFTSSWQISVLEEAKKDNYIDFYNKIFRFLVIVLMICFFAITIGSRFIIEIFTTSDFYDAWKYVPILTLGAIFSCVSGFVGSNFLVQKKSKYYFYSSVFGVFSSIILNILLIPKLGIMGASISYSFSLFCTSVFRVMYSWKYVKIKNINRYLGMLIISIVIIIIMLCIQNFLIKLISVVFIFFAFLFINYDLKDDILNIFLIFGRQKQISNKKNA